MVPIMKILLLEDEKTIREGESAYLRAAGYEVIEAAAGDEALRLFGQYEIALCLLDLNVPKIDGVEVCKRIRRLSEVPIVMVTARSSEIDELIGLRCGADDYIKKPFSPEILLARAAILLRRHSEKSLERGGLVIDPGQRSVTKNGREVSLTTTQFNILYLLASKPGAVFTRGQIVDKAYGNPFDIAVLERTIDTHIRDIRRLIEDEPGEPWLLLTVIGYGYKFRQT
jgi:DNA-binding response OmpR family regulator